MQADNVDNPGNSIDERLLTYINTEVASETVDVETDLLLTGAVDSIGVMRITQWMEDEYGLDVDPLEVTLANFQTVQRMLAFIQTKVTD